MPRRLIRAAKITFLLIACSAAPLIAQTRRPSRKTPADQTPPVNATMSESAQKWVGVWTAEFMDTTYLRLELKLVNGKLSGTIATGNMHTAEDGRLTDVSAAANAPASPLFDVSLEGDTVTFKRHHGDDVDQMQMTWTGNGAAELRFVVPQAEGASKIQPIDLTRRIER
jgi:hypothetical protein